MAPAALVWFRNDLRLADNAALAAAMASGRKVHAVHIEASDPALRRRGGASRWWLHHSLNALAKDLAALGVVLETLEGETEQLLFSVIAAQQVDAVYWNRRYAPAERDIDAAIKARCRSGGITAASFAGSVLVEPFEMETGTGKPYSVYTPFWKTLRAREIALPIAAPKSNDTSLREAEVDTGYREPTWGIKLARYWTVGEQAARARLDSFLDDLVADYPSGRDFPALSVTSRLSPHLAFGEISPHQIWHSAQALAQHLPGRTEAVDKFLSELAWRDFNYNQLYHRADIALVAMQEKFSRLAWEQPGDELMAWQEGRTGFPIVDAGMRELWETGTMHNRVRMLVGSLLAKNLLIDWRLGESWFWDTLLDADGANNPGNWQWVAGCGLDASPFFRIFNPVIQGEKFDAAGDYVRRWVPELAALPDEWLHKPFEAPPDVLSRAGVRLGVNYPRPIVELKASRERALAALGAL